MKGVRRELTIVENVSKLTQVRTVVVRTTRYHYGKKYASYVQVINMRTQETEECEYVHKWGTCTGTSINRYYN